MDSLPNITSLPVVESRTEHFRQSRQTMRSLPRVSVIMPVYNGAAYLAVAIESVLAQRFKDFELVLVNDGSTDTSGAIAHAYARRHPDRIRVIDQDNVGLPGARNRGLDAGRGDYYALLDADDVWLPNHLEQAMAAFDADPDLGLVHANICRIDAGGRRLEVPSRHWATQSDAYLAIALRFEHIACPTVVFSRLAVQTVGGFDPQFTGLGCEDRDLWLRILERFRARYIDVVAAHYRMTPGSMSADHTKMAAARQRLMCKVALSTRGRALYQQMQAMVASDLGLELSAQGRWLASMAAHARALRCEPRNMLLWRRLARSLLDRVGLGLSAMRPEPRS